MSQSRGRRNFFRYVIDELFAAVDEGRGRPSFKLSDLDALPNPEIGRLVPALIDISQVSGDGDNFFLLLPGGGREMLFATGSREEEVWSRIDGRATLQQISDDVRLTWNVPGDVAFDQVRRLFLFLVGKQLCLPLNPLA